MVTEILSMAITHGIAGVPGSCAKPEAMGRTDLIVDGCVSTCCSSFRWIRGPQPLLNRCISGVSRHAAGGGWLLQAAGVGLARLARVEGP